MLNNMIDKYYNRMMSAEDKMKVIAIEFKHQEKPGSYYVAEATMNAYECAWNEAVQLKAKIEGIIGD